MTDKFIDLFSLFENHHEHLYLVGGAVRDSILNIPTTDYDFTTTASFSKSIKILQSFNIIYTKPSLGVIKINYQDLIIEITSMRIELGVVNNRYPRMILFTRHLSLDLRRRDFTINALCMNKSGRVIDLVHGRTDLDNHILKFIGNSKRRIKEDPLRILRGLRFSLYYDLKISSSDLSLFNEYGRLISSLDACKYKELVKILRHVDAIRYIKEHLSIFNSSFKEINFNMIKSVGTSSVYLLAFITSKDLINDMISYGVFTKEETTNIKNIITFDFLNTSLYQTKCFINSFHQEESILDALYLINPIISIKHRDNIKYIYDNKLALTKQDVNISFNDLLMINDDYVLCGKVYKELVLDVLHNDSKNDYDYLINEAKKKLLKIE